MEMEGSKDEEGGVGMESRGGEGLDEVVREGSGESWDREG